jgi:hypothetical protein
LGALLQAASIVQVHVQDHDRYGRIVGTVFANGKDVNREMVRLGYAWVYRDYLKDKSLIEVETEARTNKRGLRSLHENERMPPWKWRRLKKGKKAKPTGCGEKRKCGQMSSCAEAMFYLNTCGLKHLDADRDGVPCEALCRK